MTVSFNWSNVTINSLVTVSLTAQNVNIKYRLTVSLTGQNVGWSTLTRVNIKYRVTVSLTQQMRTLNLLWRSLQPGKCEHLDQQFLH